jgi:cell division protein FtsN
MKRHIILLLSLALVSSAITAKELSKEEKKELKSQLKEYLKHPENYQKLISNYKETIDSQNSQIAQRKATINQLSNRNNDLENQVTSLQGQLKECTSKPAPVCPPCPDPAAVPSAGVIYKIQVGLFKNLDISGYLKDPKYFGLEKDGEKNRYVISYFNTKEDAEKFVAELRKLGIRGAFAAKYENGERVFETKKSKSKPTAAKPAATGKKKVPVKSN